MNLYEIYIDNGLDYGDWGRESKLIVASNEREAEVRANNWMNEVYGKSYSNASSWIEDRSEVDGFKISVRR